LASLYEDVVWREDGGVSFAANDRDETALALMQSGRLLRWGELFAMSTHRFLDDPRGSYAQARSIFAFLADDDRLASWYRTYKTTFSTDPSGALAFEREFELPIDEIEAQWRRWLLEVRPGAAPAPDDDWLPTAPETGASLAAGPAAEAVEDAAGAPSASTYQQARQHYALGDYGQAIELLKRVVELEPGHAAARYDLALSYVRRAESEAAWAELEALSALEPSLASMVRNLLLRSPRPE
jgi:tetratricopeptide (TPR) repeat protein